jgi:hypothetical protein
MQELPWKMEFLLLEILASNLVSKVSSYISGIKFLISNSKNKGKI